jgi:hypothetical protein
MPGGPSGLPHREEKSPCDPLPRSTMSRRSWTDGADGITVPGVSGVPASPCSGSGSSSSAGGGPSACRPVPRLRRQRSPRQGCPRCPPGPLAGAWGPWSHAGGAPASGNLGCVRTAPARRCRRGARPAHPATSSLPSVRRCPGARRSPPRGRGSWPCPSTGRCPCRREERLPTPRPQGCPSGETTPWRPSPPPPARPLSVQRSTLPDAQRPRTPSSRRDAGHRGCGQLAPGDRCSLYHPSDARRTMRSPSLQSPSDSRPALEHAQQLVAGAKLADFSVVLF